VAIVPMPGNFAISGLNRATNIISAAPEINNWFLSGHSAGGAAAISYARQNDSTLSGLILLGAYGAASDDLSESSLPVVSIYGTEDGVVTLDEIETSKRTLPASTLYIPLFGGNHAQFGYYGEQSGDNEAFIDHAHQHHLMAGAIHHFIKQSLYAELVDQHPGFAAAHDVGIQWCKNAQTLIAGLDDDADITVTSSTSLTAYSETKPAIESSTIEVNAFEWQGANANELRGPSIFNEEVWCKMKMQSSLPTGIAATGQPATCKDVNEAAVEWALGQLTTEERESYDAEAPALTYADDVLYETRFEWLDESNVQFDGTTLKSSRITVELTRTDLPEEYRGVHYCKVWSPARALLWTLAFE